MNNYRVAIKNFEKVKNQIKEGVVLLIRGGGIKSASSIGILKALEENNIPIVAVSGTSIGSIPAALIACGYKSDEILKIFIHYNNSYLKSTRLFNKDGSEIIEKSINALLENKNFSNTNIPCYINASDGPFYNANPFIFCKEITPNVTLGEACRASASFPFLYKPYKTNINGLDYNFTDGGSTENTFVPKTNNIIIYSSFISNREKKALKRKLFSWEKPPYIAENQSDIIFSPDLGKMGTTGSTIDIINAYLIGYQMASNLIYEIFNKNKLIYQKNIH